MQQKVEIYRHVGQIDEDTAARYGITEGIFWDARVNELAKEGWFIHTMTEQVGGAMAGAKSKGKANGLVVVYRKSG